MIKAIALAGLIFVSGPSFGPSDGMFEELKSAPTEDEAASTAADIWASWLESGSAAADLVMARGVEAQSNGELELARELYDRVIAIQPGYAEVWNRRATTFLAEENYSEALRDVNEALRLEPRHFGAWTGLGSVFESFEAYDEALQAYEKALEIYPTFEPAVKGRARIKARSGGQGL